MALAALAAVAITFAISGPRLAHLYDTSGIATCHASGDCGSAATNFLTLVHGNIADTVLYIIGAAIVYLVPALIGMFWGAHLIAPVRVSFAFNPANIEEMWTGSGEMKVIEAVNLPGAWIITNQTLTPAGQPFTGPATQACLSDSASPACQASLATLHLRRVVTYEPASRYWALQWYETAGFLAGALALAGICFVWVRRRVA